MKVYVDMEVEFTQDGALIPKRLRWKDGRVWVIDQLLHVCEVHDKENRGIRYTVKIGSAERYIYEHHGRWYVLSAEGG